jgi:hypothetical protein
MAGIMSFQEIYEVHLSARLRPSGYDAAAFATGGLAKAKLAKPAKAGGARRDRTADLLHAMQALSQLSYGPVHAARDGFSSKNATTLH